MGNTKGFKDIEDESEEDLATTKKEEEEMGEFMLLKHSLLLYSRVLKVFFRAVD